MTHAPLNPIPNPDRYGPWALITGASDGIGAEFARSLASSGYDLLLVARRRERLAALAQELERTTGVSVRILSVDLGTDEGWRRVVEESAPIDVGLVVASAGFGTSGEFVDGDLASELDMIDVNCRSLMALTHHFGRRLRRRGRGGLVLMSSLVAFQGVPRAANYAATKAYVQTLAEGLHRELAPHGVDVIACAPGPIRSGFAARADMQMGMAQEPKHVASTTLDALGKRMTVRPGWLSKFLEFSLSLVPRGIRVRIMGLVMGGMTRHQLGADARG